ncbi:hypothetical protein E4634_18525 [Mangrovimicrobium sediminis]|uniref:SnoaL-like domain-containing protein n=1 Tax=Mangrovimicrobium sediminis TaxID=2562682 RepID=A0A4Z0LVG9_9GAMM|nr:nuclear transport factor 2 family protein [Haliea sp. SAOS-164]TGD71270.1 hypothetical protein E4634_18525 [Haliea sp. SAOS-164]
MPPDSTSLEGEIVDRFYAALARKDLASALACCTENACFWHNFDDVEQNLEQAARGWQALFDGFTENRIDKVRRDPIPGGLVQRHRFLLRAADGVLKARPCCIFVSFSAGRIARLDEYIDLSGALPVEAADECA